MILPVNKAEALLLTSGEKRTDLVADPRGRWKEGREVHPWIGWPVAKGRRVELPARLFVGKVFFAEFIVRDNTCHLYLSRLNPAAVPPDEVIRWDSPAMARLAKLEGFADPVSFINSFIPGWKFADPDNWQSWQGKLIYW